MFQLILPFQLDLPFDPAPASAGGAEETLEMTSAAPAARPARVRRPRVRSRASSGAPEPNAKEAVP